MLQATKMRSLADSKHNFPAEHTSEEKYIRWRIKVSARFGHYHIKYWGRVSTEVRSRLSKSGFTVSNYHDVYERTIIYW